MYARPSLNRFVIVSFAFLGWAFYEVSGGVDFEPKAYSTQAVVLGPVQPKSATKTTPAKIETTHEATQIAITSRVTAETLATAQGQDIQTSIDTGGRTVTFKSVMPEFDEARIGYVIANSVNMRTGPGTNFLVVEKLSRRTPVYLMEDQIKGWIKLRSLETGRVGWMMRKFTYAPNLP